jgi:Leucine rich repeat
VIRNTPLWIAKDQGSKENKWIVRVGTHKTKKSINVPSETEKFSLMHNSIDEHNCSLSCTSSTPKLTTLLLNSNYLTVKTVKQLTMFPELEVLNLSNNLINCFPVEICNLDKLKFLNLSENVIQSLPEKLKDLTNLRYLLLKQKKIRTIPNGILSKLTELRVLDLSENIYLCLGVDLQLLVHIEALRILVYRRHGFKKLNDLKVPIVDLISDFTFPCSFLENPHMRTDLFSLVI